MSYTNKYKLSHGFARRGKKTPEFIIWMSMKQRCDNPRNAGFKNYGGRGIAVCDRWRKFENFIADMGARPSSGHSIERIDNDGNYEPSNCKWATRKEQARNTRSSCLVVVKGRQMSFAQAQEETGIPSGTIRSRIRNGWSCEEATTTPPMRFNQPQCGRGHDLSGYNLYIEYNGYRRCRRCHSDAARRRYLIQKERGK